MYSQPFPASEVKSFAVLGQVVHILILESACHISDRSDNPFGLTERRTTTGALVGFNMHYIWQIKVQIMIKILIDNNTIVNLIVKKNCLKLLKLHFTRRASVSPYKKRRHLSINRVRIVLKFKKWFFDVDTDAIVAKLQQSSGGQVTFKK
jgi:hypothetical protein